jgi:hypothetical protein
MPCIDARPTYGVPVIGWTGDKRLGAGMDVVGVSERLGHWSPSLTLSVYAHAIRGRQAEVAKVIGSALG